MINVGEVALGSAVQREAALHERKQQQQQEYKQQQKKKPKGELEVPEEEE